jgi:hypothetical protein
MLTEIKKIVSAAAKVDTIKIDNNKINKYITDYWKAIEVFKNSANKKFIYRANAFNSSTPLFINNVTFRTSAATNNIYNVLISDILPSWKNWPKRNQSVIFSTDYADAGRYTSPNDNYSLSGKSENRRIYYVFPKNDAKLVVCPKSDMWVSFKNINTLDNFNKAFAIIISNVCKQINKINTAEQNQYSSYGSIIKLFKNNNISEILNLFNYIDNNIASVKNEIENCARSVDHLDESKILVKMLWSIVVDNTTLIKELDDLMNPEYNGFSLISVDNLNSLVSEKSINEVYTDSSCLLLLNVYDAKTTFAEYNNMYKEYFDLDFSKVD